MKKKAALFLYGVYRKEDISFFEEHVRGRFLIAVDGGYNFFKKSSLTPDLLIGDFDSIKAIPNNLPEATEVVSHPPRKDATDAELALEYCLERGMTDIEVVQPSYGEPDHFAGNLLLLSTVDRFEAKGKKPKVRLLSPKHEIRYVSSGRTVFNDAKGNTVSVVPLSDEISLTCTGTDYDVRDLDITRGATVGLRNRIRTQRATFEIAGQALVFHTFRA